MGYISDHFQFDLETNLERTAYLLDTIDYVEGQRSSKVQRLLLEHDNVELRAEVARALDEAELLSLDHQSMRAELATANAAFDKCRGEARSNSREVLALKAELESLHGITSDSNRLLTEKLALARELASLKPELEHLRKQVDSQQSVLAEKLSLQRQIGTLQVELENEKRSCHRLADKGHHNRQGDMKKLEMDLAKLQDELTRERKGKVETDRDNKKAAQMFGVKMQASDSKVAALQAELSTAKERLKSKDAELRLVKTQATAQPGPDNKRPSKRQFSLIDDHTIIGTPGDRTFRKKARNKPVTMGEKSTFSISPFLSQTTAIRRGNPAPSSNSIVHDQRKASPASNGIEADAYPGLASIVDSDNYAEGKALFQVRKGSVRKNLPGSVAASATLEQVVEEDHDWSGQQGRGSDKDCHARATVAAGASAITKQTKTRSLASKLVPTLFDDIDDIAIGGSSLESLRRHGIGKLQRNGPAKGKLFGPISPLKNRQNPRI